MGRREGVAVQRRHAAAPDTRLAPCTTRGGALTPCDRPSPDVTMSSGTSCAAARMHRSRQSSRGRAETRPACVASTPRPGARSATRACCPPRGRSSPDATRGSLRTRLATHDSRRAERAAARSRHVTGHRQTRRCRRNESCAAAHSVTALTHARMHRSRHSSRGRAETRPCGRGIDAASRRLSRDSQTRPIIARRDARITANASRNTRLAPCRTRGGALTPCDRPSPDTRPCMRATDALSLDAQGRAHIARNRAPTVSCVTPRSSASTAPSCSPVRVTRSRTGA